MEKSTTTSKSQQHRKISPSEYLDSFTGIIRPLTRDNRVLNTIVSNLEAYVEFNDPSDTCVKGCEDKLINHIKMLRAGNITKSETTPVVMHVTVMPSEKNQLSPQVATTPQTGETSPELTKVQGMNTEHSNNMAELTKAVVEQARIKQKALDDIKAKQGAAMNVIQAQERYDPIGGKGNKGKGKG